MTVTQTRKEEMYQELKECVLDHIKFVYLHEDHVDDVVDAEEMNVTVDSYLHDLSTHRPGYTDLSDDEWDDLQYTVWEEMCECYFGDGDVLDRNLV